MTNQKEESEKEPIVLDYVLNLSPISTSNRKFVVEPTVILFGWGGCEHRYLTKYSETWQKEGCVAVRFIIPVKTVSWLPERVGRFTDQLADELYDEDNGLGMARNPTIFHSFSGTGCFLLRNMLDSLAAKNIQLDIRGYIFDSAPAKSTFWSLGMSFAECRMDPRTNRCFKYLAGCFYTCVFWLYDKYRYIFRRSTYRAIGSFYDELQQKDLGPRQLYIYTEADHLCPSKSIEQFIDVQRRRIGDENVRTLKFQNTKHCQHLREKPEEYVGALRGFLDWAFVEGRDFTRCPQQQQFSVTTDSMSDVTANL